MIWKCVFVGDMQCWWLSELDIAIRSIHSVTILLQSCHHVSPHPTNTKCWLQTDT